MAKGQIRSNREVRKPKKDKAVKAPQPQLGAQVKLAVDNMSHAGKKK